MTTALKGRLRAAMGKAETPAPAAAVEPDNDADRDLTDDEKANHLFRWSPQFAEALPACVDLPAFESAVRGLVPTLGRCRVSSIVQALLACARFGLVPDGRQAAIVADGDRAVFIPMYQGYVDLMHRSGHVRSVRRGFIYEGDGWTWEPSAAPPFDFTHKVSALSRAERGDPVAAYAFAWLPGTEGLVRSQVIVTTLEDAEDVRDYHSRQFRRAEENGRRDSAWHTDFRAMWAKTPVRGLSKIVPMSAEVRALVAVEDAGDAGQVQVLLAPELEPRGPEQAPAAEEPENRRVEAARRRVARSKGKRQRGGPKGAAA
ncbi:recombinase RecT [Streptomyces sp. NPDC001552]|uniref:recombinase RecT n=1 Tax=Streptomyces sp. NPDC001552 TaxID=3364587 RepID=UPI0036868200